MINDAFEDSEGTYGDRRIQAILKRNGVRADGTTIRSIMRGQGLQAAQPQAEVATTMLAEDLAERPDLLGRNFTADEPRKKLYGDMSVSARGTGSSTWPPFQAAAPGKWWGMRWTIHVRAP